MQQVSENLQRNLRQEQGLQLELSTTFFSQVREGDLVHTALSASQLLSSKPTTSKPHGLLPVHFSAQPALTEVRCLAAQALTPIQMATAATESYPWWPDILAMLNAACDGAALESCRSYDDVEVASSALHSTQHTIDNNTLQTTDASPRHAAGME